MRVGHIYISSELVPNLFKVDLTLTGNLFNTGSLFLSRRVSNVKLQKSAVLSRRVSWGSNPSQKIEGEEDGVDNEAEEPHVAKDSTVTLAWICTQTMPSTVCSLTLISL